LNIISWFQNVPFKCNVYRYSEELDFEAYTNPAEVASTSTVGRCKLNPLDP
jgi:hypothetical protein